MTASKRQIPDKRNAKEKALFEAINNKEDSKAMELIADSDVEVDCCDENGMSALMAAAFRGNIPMCRALLERGADVNWNEHGEGYTTLMFAAFSGNADLCKLLLEAGAKTHRTNRLGKTASEMAAFCGQHHCVSVINNFLSRDDVESIMHPAGSRDPPRIPLELSPVLHDLARTCNVHPVRTVLYLYNHQELLEHRKQLLYIIEALFERQMRQKETNELMAFKIHVILYTLRGFFEYLDKQRETHPPEKASDEKLLYEYARALLQADTKWHFCERMEILLRRTVQRWPYHHCQLFQTILRQLANTPFGDEPTAINIIQQVVLGQRAVMDGHFCSACGEQGSHKRCKGCSMVLYCSERCQKLHWKTHKRWCSELKELSHQQATQAEEQKQCSATELETGTGGEELSVADIKLDENKSEP